MAGRRRTWRGYLDSCGSEERDRSGAVLVTPHISCIVRRGNHGSHGKSDKWSGLASSWQNHGLTKGPKTVRVHYTIVLSRSASTHVWTTMIVAWRSTGLFAILLSILFGTAHGVGEPYTAQYSSLSRVVGRSSTCAQRDIQALCAWRTDFNCMAYRLKLPSITREEARVSQPLQPEILLLLCAPT